MRTNLAAKREAHALLYERGARCSSGGGGYCGLPVESLVSPEALSAGGALTLTARGVAGEAFASPLLDAESAASLSAAGWGLALNANANPDEVVLSRESGGPDLGVAFTISLLSGAGDAIREYQVGVRRFWNTRRRRAGVCPRRLQAGGGLTPGRR